MKNYKQNPDKKTQQKNVVKSESVTKYMAKNLITFTPDTDISEVIESLLDNRISGAPVLNKKGEVVGLIDDKDCLRVLIDGVYHNQPISNTVESYMTSVMKTISVDSDIIDVADIFLHSPFKRLLVLDTAGKLVGQVSRRDILRAIKIMNSTTWHKS
jgi:predicted transcriptional regulator